jgi:GNAT superfamily N-acetyltransferase
MFRIRTITNDLYPRDKSAIEQVKHILISHFPAVDPEKFDLIPEQLKNPLKYKFSVRIFILENFSGIVKGFATLYYAPDINFCYLDYIATNKNLMAGGVGSALYEKVREESKELRAQGLFFECLPDFPELCRDAGIINENKQRLRFYEKFGARPIINTLYELPVNESDTCPPLLVYDDLDNEVPITGKSLRNIVAAILERKYPDYCPVAYRNKVLNSIQDGPVERRPLIYRKNHRG